jgi:hypothetical protein
MSPEADVPVRPRGSAGPGPLAPGAGVGASRAVPWSVTD